MNANATLVNVEAVAHHRNGICGEPFHVGIFLDEEGSRYLAIWLDAEAEQSLGAVPCFVVNLELAAASNIAFGENSWRGDVFKDEIDELIQEKERG